MHSAVLMYLLPASVHSVLQYCQQTHTQPLNLSHCQHHNENKKKEKEKKTAELSIKSVTKSTESYL